MKKENEQKVIDKIQQLTLLLNRKHEDYETNLDEVIDKIEF